jgi:hypothetical protein
MIFSVDGQAKIRIAIRKLVCGKMPDQQRLRKELTP